MRAPVFVNRRDLFGSEVGFWKVARVCDFFSDAPLLVPLIFWGKGIGTKPLSECRRASESKTRFFVNRQYKQTKRL